MKSVHKLLKKQEGFEPSQFYPSLCKYLKAFADSGAEFPAFAYIKIQLFIIKCLIFD